MRTEGAKKLLASLGPGQVGRLRVRNTDYVLMRAETFDALYGQAQDVHRLQGALVLLRQAVQIVLHLGKSQDSEKFVVEKVAIEHLHDLAVQFPELATGVFEEGDQESEDDEGGVAEASPRASTFILDPTLVKRPTLTRPEDRSRSSQGARERTDNGASSDAGVK
jgi:hypothetical protein